MGSNRVTITKDLEITRERKTVKIDGLPVIEAEEDEFTAYFNAVGQVFKDVEKVKDDPTKTEELKHLRGKFMGLLKSNGRVQSAYMMRTSGVSDQVKEEMSLKLQIARQAQKIVVVFMVDCTGSMGKWIDAVKAKIKELSEAYVSCHSGAQIAFGFVGYRDHGISAPFSFEVNANVDKFQKWLKDSVHAHSDKDSEWSGKHLDEAEDVAGGLRVVTSLNWDFFSGNTTRVLVHIADAPCHGDQFTPAGSIKDGDRYKDLSDTSKPNGGVEWNDPIPHLRFLRNALKVHYFFGKISDKTDVMIKQFKSETSESWIEQRALPDVSLLASTVLRTLNTAVMKTASSQGNAIEHLLSERPMISDCSTILEEEEEEEELDAFDAGNYSVGVDKTPAAVDWSSIREQTLKNMRCCDTIAGLHVLQSDAQIRTVVATTANKWRVKICKDPFAEGASRWAYHARMNFGGGVGDVPYVLKRFKDSGSKWAKHSPVNYLDTTKTSAVASFLAHEFNTRVERGEFPGCSPVTYLHAFACQMQVDGERIPRNYCAEPKLPDGAFTKWCNNTGQWDWQAVGNDMTLPTFAKFTFDATNTYMMVADLQGVRTSHGYTLTDPVILCKNPHRYPPTNLGPEALRAQISQTDCILQFNVKNLA